MSLHLLMEALFILYAAENIRLYFKQSKDKILTLLSIKY